MDLNEQGHEGVSSLKSFIRGPQQFMDRVGTGYFLKGESQSGLIQVQSDQAYKTAEIAACT